jgi:hypothetical protein
MHSDADIDPTANADGHADSSLPSAPPEPATFNAIWSTNVSIMDTAIPSSISFLQVSYLPPLSSLFLSSFRSMSKETLLDVSSRAGKDLQLSV